VTEWQITALSVVNGWTHMPNSFIVMIFANGETWLVKPDVLDDTANRKLSCMELAAN
jgi:hypothetical protein